jgi:hypothetical protein
MFSFRNQLFQQLKGGKKAVPTKWWVEKHTRMHPHSGYHSVLNWKDTLACYHVDELWGHHCRVVSIFSSYPSEFLAGAPVTKNKTKQNSMRKHRYVFNLRKWTPKAEVKLLCLMLDWWGETLVDGDEMRMWAESSMVEKQPTCSFGISLVSWKLRTG